MSSLILILVPRFALGVDPTETGEHPAARDHSTAGDHHALGTVTPNFAEFDVPNPDPTSKVLMLVAQLALILAAAKIGGWLCEKIKVPGVLGELGAGMLIGPFALGSLILVYTHHGWVPLFPAPASDTGWPVSDALWGIAVVASIVLLFVAGLHTNLKQFFENLAPASLVAVGGVVPPFILGAIATVWFMDNVTSWTDPAALFMGAIMVATSVGITARVLGDIRRLDTPEGVTILGGAVVDDVLGILVLAIVVGIAKAEASGNEIDAAAIGITAGKAFGVWIGITAISLALANHIERLFKSIKYAGARVGLALGLALLCAAVAEMFGLAFIIGAYSVGLGLSRTKMAHELMDDLEQISHFIVPIFFAVMGMLVNFQAMAAVLSFGLVVSFFGIISKLLGCGLPALIWFNKRGAARIGMGMLPRGEVALIIAGVGLAQGVITSNIFGVAIMMTLVTTIIAPLGLVPLFKGGPGKRGLEALPAEQETEPIIREWPASISHFFVRLLVKAFEQNGFNCYEETAGVVQAQRNDVVCSIIDREGRVIVDAPQRAQADAHAVVAEAEKVLVASVQRAHELPLDFDDNGPDPSKKADHESNSA
jgi:Kef-type K+ transport system membrane component KefB